MFRIIQRDCFFWHGHQRLCSYVYDDYVSSLKHHCVYAYAWSYFFCVYDRPLDYQSGDGYGVCGSFS
jgi:hypothetical protein